MSLSQVFELVYYSHITLVLLAMVLTGSISAVLYAQIKWQVILLVGIATYFTYSLDNLFDWKRDLARYRNIQELVQIYHRITYLLIPAAAIGILILTLVSNNELKIGIFLLGAAVAMGTTRFSIYRNNSSSPSQSISGFILNRLFITTIWTTVCVFLPNWYNNTEIIGRTWNAFFYIYCLIFPYAVLWKIESSAEPLKIKLLSSILMRVIVAFPVISIYFAIVDVISGAAHIVNLFNLLPPISIIVILFVINKKPNALKKKISLLTIILTLLCGSSALIHLIAG
ncbi:MAG: hypothetical protein U9R53_04100 [Chloroflexota bacterium]|nr:hypothetical protein [Chloroflexota bacterium]